MSFIRNYHFIVPLPVPCQTEACYTVDHSKHTLPYPNSTVPNQNIPSHVMRFSTLSPEPTWALLNRILGRASFAFFLSWKHPSWSPTTESDSAVWSPHRGFWWLISWDLLCNSCTPKNLVTHSLLYHTKQYHITLKLTMHAGQVQMSSSSLSSDLK